MRCAPGRRGRLLGVLWYMLEKYLRYHLHDIMPPHGHSLQVFVPPGRICNERIPKNTKSDDCKNALAKRKGFHEIPETDLMNQKTRGRLIHQSMTICFVIGGHWDCLCKESLCVTRRSTIFSLQTYIFKFFLIYHKEGTLFKTLHYTYDYSNVC